MDFSRIFPKLWIGSCLRDIEEIDCLAQETGASAILSLMTDQDIARFCVPWPALASHCSKKGIELRRWPVEDGDSEDLREKLPDCVAMLYRLLASQHCVYLHCVAGIERSPSVAIAYLHWCLGYDLEEAFAYVDESRGCSPDLEAIRLATEDLLGGAPRDKAWRMVLRNSIAGREQS